MEDNLYLDQETPVDHNAQLVERVRDVLGHSQRSLADATTVASRFDLPEVTADDDVEATGTTRP